MPCHGFAVGLNGAYMPVVAGGRDGIQTIQAKVKVRIGRVRGLGWAGDFLTKAVWKCLCWLHDTHLVCGMFQIFSSFTLPACPFSGTGLWWGPLIRPVPYSLVSVQLPRSSLEIISSWGHRSVPQTESESALRVPGWHCVSVSLSCLPHSVSGDRSCVVPSPLLSACGLSSAGTV